VSDDCVIKIENLTFSYNSKPVLKDVNLCISRNEFIWIVGPNGGGKTTLIKLILGLLQPREGSIKVLGKSPVASRRRIGYMPQHIHLDKNFPVTVLDVALMGRITGGFKPGWFSFKDKKAALEALEMVSLREQIHMPMAELSGGQQRRLLIARALAGKTELLLLDEPTANLDRKVEKELFDLLRLLNKQLTIVMVSHDPAFVSDFVEQVVCVNRTVAVHPTTVMGREFIDELYGTKMRLVRHDKHSDEAGEKAE